MPWTGRTSWQADGRSREVGEQSLELSVGALPREAAGDSRIDPEQEALLAESVGLALYVVMDALTPAERVSFVLHDVFEIPFSAIPRPQHCGRQDAGQPGPRTDPPGHTDDGR